MNVIFSTGRWRKKRPGGKKLPHGEGVLFSTLIFLSVHFVWDFGWWSASIRCTPSKSFSSIVAHLFWFFPKIISKFRLIFFTQNRRFLIIFLEFSIILTTFFFGKSEQSHASDRGIISRGPIVTIRSRFPTEKPFWMDGTGFSSYCSPLIISYFKENTHTP